MGPDYFLEGLRTNWKRFESDEVLAFNLTGETWYSTPSFFTETSTILRLILWVQLNVLVRTLRARIVMTRAVLRISLVLECYVMSTKRSTRSSFLVKARYLGLHHYFMYAALRKLCYRSNYWDYWSMWKYMVRVKRTEQHRALASQLLLKGRLLLFEKSLFTQHNTKYIDYQPCVFNIDVMCVLHQCVVISL